MVDVITPLQFSLLQGVAKHPGITRERLLALRGVQEADITYLVQQDLIRGQEMNAYRVTHFGQMALKRGL